VSTAEWRGDRGAGPCRRGWRPARRVGM